MMPDFDIYEMDVSEIHQLLLLFGCYLVYKFPQYNAKIKECITKMQEKVKKKETYSIRIIFCFKHQRKYYMASLFGSVILQKMLQQVVQNKIH